MYIIRFRGPSTSAYSASLDLRDSLSQLFGTIDIVPYKLCSPDSWGLDTRRMQLVLKHHGLTLDVVREFGRDALSKDCDNSPDLSR